MRAIILTNMGIKKILRGKIARYAIKALVKFPQTVSEPLIKVVLEKIWRQKITNVHQMLASVKRLSDTTSKNCQEKLFENLAFKGLIENQKIRDEGARHDLPFEIFDKVIKEGKEMGVVFFTILGGEPFLRNDLCLIFEKHPDVYFQVFTNSTLLNDEVVRKLAELGSVAIQFSIEGLKERDDKRRGKGHFEKVMTAMDIARKHGVLFGYSVCVTKENVEEVVSDEFLELMTQRGGVVGWYFLYMPVCGDRTTEPMPLPEQRKLMKERRDYIRTHYPILIIDFWNDAPYVGGCISAKYYCHINNFGDVEPCIFAHFAQANIKNCSLKETLNCELFKEIRSRQPFDKNLFLPCPLIDTPWESRTFFKIPGVYPTHPQASTLIEDLKDDLDKYSQEVHRIYTPVWEEWAKRK